MRDIKEPILVGADTTPTTRPDGSALQNGDWICMTGSSNVKRYVNGTWLLNATVYQTTGMIPVSDPTAEAGNLQYGANRRHKSDISSKWPVNSIVLDETSTAEGMAAKYGGTWTLVNVNYGYDYKHYSNGSHHIVARRQDQITLLSYATSSTIAKSNGNLVLGITLDNKFLPVSNISTRISMPVGSWGNGNPQGSIWAGNGTMTPNFESYFGSITSNFMGNVAYPSNLSYITPKFYIWKRTA